MKKKYCVTVVRTGCVFVEAETEEQAKDIAYHQTTDTVNWSEDWTPADAYEDDSAVDSLYISEKAFD